MQHSWNGVERSAQLISSYPLYRHCNYYALNTIAQTLYMNIKLLWTT